MRLIFVLSALVCMVSCVAEGDTRRPVSRSFPEYITTALAFNGYSEQSNRSELRTLTGVDPVRTEWCAAFVNAILRINGIAGSESVSDNPLMARSFLEWGVEVETPKIGDIVVFSRGNSGWKGHVGFYVRTVVVNGREYYAVLGGNQRNEVNILPYAKSRVLGIRREK